MQLKIKKLYEDSILPTRGNPEDAGIDVYARSLDIKGTKDESGNYTSIDYLEYKTGIAIQPFDSQGWKNAEFENEMYKKIAESGDFLKELGFSADQTSSSFSKLEKYFTYIAPRSSNSKTNLIQCNSNGIIDSGYTGEVIIRYKYIPDVRDFVLFDGRFGVRINPEKIHKIGDKIGQLVVTKQETVDVVEVSEFSKTNRGEKAFGSSGT